jgi:hypothetical protein
VDEGIFEIEGEYKNRNIRLKRKGEKDKNLNGDIIWL